MQPFPGLIIFSWECTKVSRAGTYHFKAFSENLQKIEKNLENYPKICVGAAVDDCF